MVVVDVEATCWPKEEREQSAETMEIIEIGAVLVDRSGRVIDEYSCLVMPTENPTLSPFCSQLTGITQEMVSSAVPLSEAMPAFNDWVRATGVTAWASWGKYDLHQFTFESERKSVTTHLLALPHLNLKRAWRRSTKARGQALLYALDHHGMTPTGQHHRGLDDAKNIVRLLPFINGESLIRELDE